MKTILGGISRNRHGAFALALAFWLLALDSMAQTKEISHSQTPPQVLAAIEKKLDGAEIERVTIVEENGRQVYRIEAGKDGAAGKLIFHVAEDGTLLRKKKPSSKSAAQSSASPTPTPVPGSTEVRVLPLSAAGPKLLSVKDADGVTRLKTRDLEVRVQHDPWRLSVLDKQGRILLREAEVGGMRYGEHRVARTVSHAVLGRSRIVKRAPPRYHAEDETVIDGESVRFDCETTEAGRKAAVYISFAAPGVFSLWLTVPGTIQPTSVSFESSPDEHFFGLGECWDAQSLDLKGIAVTMANTGGTPDQGGYVPFFLSTRGYGLLVDNYLPVKFDYTRPDAVAITAPPIAGSIDGAGYFDGSSLLWYFYLGPKPLDVIDRFTAHVSRPAQPPSWAMFAPWSWRDTSNEAEVYQDARGLREAGIPCGVLFVDRPWATGNAYMPPPFEWMADRFPNGSKMFRDLNDMGYKTGVWVAKNLYGDFDDPALNAKLKQDAQPWLRRDNAQMYKIDRGNEQRMDPYFTCQAYWEAWDEVFHGDFVTLPRVVAFRGSKHVNGKWPGDNMNSYEYPSGLKANVAAMLNLAISGFPFWGADTGGFPDPPGNEVTVRWSQFSAFCPIFQTAGAPYLYDEPFRSIFRDYARLYTQLYPYRWSYARLAHEKGHPIARALALQYSDDPAGYAQKFEYLFGEWLLVAPMVAGGTQREVYLPQGRWIDWWDGRVYEGGRTILYTAPLEKLPLLARAGAIVPMIPVQQTWQNASMSPMTLRIYPEGQSSFTIRADDLTYPHRPEPYTALEQTEIQCQAKKSGVTIDIGKSSVAYRLEVHLMQTVESVKADGERLKKHATAAALDQAGAGWFHDLETRTLWVLIPAEGTRSHCVKIKS